MRVLLIVGSLLAMPCSAQHCGYDFSSVVVVRPHANGDSTIIDGLRITLLDSNNVPVVHHGRPWHLFHRNTEHDLRRRTRSHFDVPDYFPFALDNYVLTVPSSFRTAKMKVLVQDERDAGPLNTRRDGWPVRFKHVLVPLTVFDEYPLCGVFDEDVYPELRDHPAFHPVDITLYQR